MDDLLQILSLLRELDALYAGPGETGFYKMVLYGDGSGRVDGPDDEDVARFLDYREGVTMLLNYRLTKG